LLKSNKFSINSPCPCGSGKKYKKCCGIYHKGSYPKDVLTLMKSRYSAFVVGKIDYIIKTSTFQTDYEDLKSFSKTCEFKKLDIIDYGEDYVTFKATIICGENRVDNSFIEKSKFIKVDDKWKYDSAEILN